MLLQRLTKLARLQLLLLALLLGACATPGSKPPPAATTGGRAPSAAVIGADGQVLRAEIPARALTLYEQAAAVMASGDFLDAELRFKEFLLEYPAYPGAHVNLAIIHNGNGNDEAARLWRLG